MNESTHLLRANIPRSFRIRPKKYKDLRLAILDRVDNFEKDLYQELSDYVDDFQAIIRNTESVLKGEIVENRREIVEGFTQLAEDMGVQLEKFAEEGARVTNEAKNQLQESINQIKTILDGFKTSGVPLEKEQVKKLDDMLVKLTLQAGKLTVIAEEELPEMRAINQSIAARGVQIDAKAGVIIQQNKEIIRILTEQVLKQIEDFMTDTDRHFQDLRTQIETSKRELDATIVEQAKATTEEMKEELNKKTKEIHEALFKWTETIMRHFTKEATALQRAIAQLQEQNAGIPAEIKKQIDAYTAVVKNIFSTLEKGLEERDKKQFAQYATIVVQALDQCAALNLIKEKIPDMESHMGRMKESINLLQEVFKILGELYPKMQENLRAVKEDIAAIRASIDNLTDITRRGLGEVHKSISEMRKDLEKLSKQGADSLTLQKEIKSNVENVGKALKSLTGKIESFTRRPRGKIPYRVADIMARFNDTNRFITRMEKYMKDELGVDIKQLELNRQAFNEVLQNLVTNSQAVTATGEEKKEIDNIKTTTTYIEKDIDFIAQLIAQGMGTISAQKTVEFMWNFIKNQWEVGDGVKSIRYPDKRLKDFVEEKIKIKNNSVEALGRWLTAAHEEIKKGADSPRPFEVERQRLFALVIMKGIGSNFRSKVENSQTFFERHNTALNQFLAESKKRKEFGAVYRSLNDIRIGMNNARISLEKVGKLLELPKKSTLPEKRKALQQAEKELVITWAQFTRWNNAEATLKSTVLAMMGKLAQQVA